MIFGAKTAHLLSCTPRLGRGGRARGPSPARVRSPAPTSLNEGGRLSGDEPMLTESAHRKRRGSAGRRLPSHGTVRGPRKASRVHRAASSYS